MGKGKLYKFLDPQGTYNYKLDPDPRKTNPDLKKLFTLFTTINKIKNKFTVKSGKYLWFPTVYFVMLTMLT